MAITVSAILKPHGTTPTLVRQTFMTYIVGSLGLGYVRNIKATVTKE